MTSPKHNSDLVPENYSKDGSTIANRCVSQVVEHKSNNSFRNKINQFTWVCLRDKLFVSCLLAGANRCSKTVKLLANKSNGSYNMSQKSHIREKMHSFHFTFIYFCSRSSAYPKINKEFLEML